jgi:hypothetical protein
MRSHRLCTFGIALVATGLIAAPGTASADTEVLTYIAAQVSNAPHGVTGADGRSHLVYEIRLANTTRSSVTLESVEARSPGGARLAALSEGALESRVRIDGGKGGLVLEPGWGGAIFMDAIVGRGRKPPSRLVHRFKLLVQPPAPSPPRSLSFTGAATAVVDDPPVVIAPPLRGSRWLAATGCCVLGEHRAAVLPINGRLYAAQRFAIDFLQLTADNRLFSGPIGDFASYRSFGAKVRSVAAGRVVRIQKGQPQQVPGQFPAATTPLTAGGNFIVVRIAPGRYAFYGHLQSASIKVRAGDSVTRGQVIALLGNSGHSGGPHLHFHVMDGPSPLASNGLPFELTSFTGHGVVTDESTLPSGDPQPVDTRTLAGRHRRQMPLTDQILSFG